ncbi:1-deoxy-D-xylulose-5-phosphate reductoisomerase [Salisediminibacterium selenitireducens]|uniref:1-deoxy-D-xylulose 5-phosphate reductoisomerase n=1 Tax=Bacillus selenitireducens (strain ATCC 700615 / DSM 15326 / MLS10) TaxID=439292 RepID=D6XU01_BACIE|nr:1-deoxy-D-xylulose-5-phosphate reductoisomerase [Salisediminibacterium selenitireducens]ADH99287.1 1-deoxy-D-xylulose 5-phosphate reductoisomerase [[Bacillus] selenitireducens MLS10]
MKRITLLGSTGSIGTQTLEVLRSNPDKFQLGAMSFGTNVDLGAKQANEFKPSVICTGDQTAADQLRGKLHYQAEILFGLDGLTEVAVSEADMLVNAVMGRVGLEPTLKAIESGIDVAIANKETLVTAGHLVTEAAEKQGVSLLPVDSEHSAIYQCLHGNVDKEVSQLILTASGGSFRDYKRSDLENVTVDQALNHPNWSMGAKITIDSASMMNKGLEVIEAKWLFNMSYDKISVIQHRESIVHSMVEYVDGSVLAHMGTPDMKVPIQYALSHPERLALQGGQRLKLWEVGKLHFEEMDYERFRLLKLAFDAGRAGGTAPTVLNAANEAAVDLFLNRKISFLDIETIVERALNDHQTSQNPPLEEIIEVDRSVRSAVLADLT